SEKEDDKLIRAGGGSGTGGKAVQATADHIRHVVIANHLAKAAWGARGLCILTNLKVLQEIRGVSSAVTSLIGPVGMVIAAAMSAHGAISATVAKDIATSLQADLDTGLKEGIAALAADAAAAPAPVSSGAPRGRKGRRSDALPANPVAGFADHLGIVGWLSIAASVATVSYFAYKAIHER
ncbi:MAG: hypothetical protein WCP53_10525, partial [Verrucomicrobiota bacterium]